MNVKFGTGPAHTTYVEPNRIEFSGWGILRLNRMRTCLKWLDASVSCQSWTLYSLCKDGYVKVSGRRGLWPKSLETVSP